ncbi:MAG: hypothetical protein JJU19_14110 [Pararhodobacter sp.]|nr:hypothetical protein [Pararhodobacter sp.]
MHKRTEQDRPGIDWMVLGAALVSLALAVLTASLVDAQGAGQAIGGASPDVMPAPDKPTPAIVL